MLEIIETGKPDTQRPRSSENGLERTVRQVCVRFFTTSEINDLRNPNLTNLTKPDSKPDAPAWVSGLSGFSLGNLTTDAGPDGQAGRAT